MKRTVARLADGREIIYFDEDAEPRHRLDDPRDLPSASTHSEMRFDAVLDEWVTIASHRQTRTHLPPAAECPLCPSRDGRTTEIPSEDYDVVVFENRFPSLTGDGDVGARPEELFLARPGNGRCEVVCFTSDHDSSFSQLSTGQARTVVDVWVDRTDALGRRRGVEQVFCFENRGEEIGVTLRHPHGQIYAFPYVTPRTRTMLGSARRHAERTGRNLFADLLAGEREAGDRVVVATDRWTAFVPFAARWPVEVHLYPNRQVPDLAALDEDERDELAHVYLDLLRRLDALYNLPLPYIAAWHQAPVRVDRDLSYLHLQVFSIRRAPDKLKYLAGTESAMGAFMSDVSPEDVAARLRAAGAG
ncbi:MAG: galactose-1-phosphate uridylyltransferase [Actinomycetes bacterium]